MPGVLRTPKKDVELSQTALEMLEQKIAKLWNRTDDEYVYKVMYEDVTEDGPAMLAVAEMGNVYALYAPEYLTDEQLGVFEYFLRRLRSNDCVVVFSQRDYDAVKKHLYGKEVDVKLII